MILSNKLIKKFWIIFIYLLTGASEASIQFQITLIKWGDANTTQQANHHWTIYQMPLDQKINPAKSWPSSYDLNISSNMSILRKLAFIMPAKQHNVLLGLSNKPYKDNITGSIKIAVNKGIIKLQPRIFKNYNDLYYMIPFMAIKIKPGFWHYVDCQYYGLIIQTNKIT